MAATWELYSRSRFPTVHRRLSKFFDCPQLSAHDFVKTAQFLHVASTSLDFVTHDKSYKAAATTGRKIAKADIKYPINNTH